MNTNNQYVPMTAQQMVDQTNLIREIIKGVMKMGTHYGKIPGTGDRLCLLKPGAEILLATFRIAGKPEIQNLSTGTSIRYLVCLHGHHVNGDYVGAGIGECSSDEDRYQWVRVKCKQEFDGAPEHSRRMKWYSDGSHDLMVRANVHNYANTVLKIAKKRALVDLALTATAASEFFTQDLEDNMLDALVLDNKEPAATENKMAAAIPASSPLVDTIIEIVHESRDNWTRFDIMTGQGFKISTFKPEIMRQAQPFAGLNLPVTIRWGKSSGGFLDLYEVREQEPSQHSVWRSSNGPAAIKVPVRI